MAKILQSVLGDMLYIPPKNEQERLPSPEDLKEKVLIKGKAAASPTVEPDVDSEDEAQATAPSEKKEAKDTSEKKDGDSQSYF